jgi:hypothetical protein
MSTANNGNFVQRTSNNCRNYRLNMVHVPRLSRRTLSWSDLDEMGMTIQWETADKHLRHWRKTLDNSWQGSLIASALHWGGARTNNPEQNTLWQLREKQNYDGHQWPHCKTIMPAKGILKLQYPSKRTKHSVLWCMQELSDVYFQHRGYLWRLQLQLQQGTPRHRSLHYNDAQGRDKSKYGAQL